MALRLLVSAALRGAAGGRAPAAGGGRAALRRLSSSAGHPAPAEEREGEVRAGPGRRGAAASGRLPAGFADTRDPPPLPL